MFIFLGLCIFALSSTYFFICTTRGSELLARGLLSSYVGSRYVEVENISGNLAQGLIFNNVNIKNLKKLPLGTTISVRCLHLACEGIGLKGF